MLNIKTLITDQRTSWFTDVLFLSFVLGGFYFLLLGSRPLWVPDEGRYAEIAREMVVTKDYITPYLNGVHYFEKPVLFYWLGALAIKLGGLNIWSLRSINALLALLALLLTYSTTRTLYDRLTALLASFILATSTLYFAMAHMINLDLTVTVLITSCLYFFLLGIQSTSHLKRRSYLYIATFSSACAVLTKGLIGLILPLIIIGMWILLLSRWQWIKRLYLPSCLLLFLAITLPWHLLVGYYNPGFFYFYFIEQHILRYALPDIGHYQPIWFFIPILILGFFPWIVFLPQAILKNLPSSLKTRQHHGIELFLLLWAGFVFLFFSFSKSKLIPYILPLFPPLSILTARYLIMSIQQSSYFAIKISYIVLCCFTLMITGLWYFKSQYTLLFIPQTGIFFLNTASIILLIGTLISTLSALRQHIGLSLILTIITAILFLLTTLAAVPSLDSRTILPLAIILKPQLQPSDEVITYQHYYQDLPFYLERRVSILNWRNELSYGMRYQDTSSWLINDETFSKRWHSQKRIFVIMRKEDYPQFILHHPKEKMYRLGETQTQMLMSNDPQRDNP